jgi:hypothetical protein
VLCTARLKYAVVSSDCQAEKKESKKEVHQNGRTQAARETAKRTVVRELRKAVMTLRNLTV